MGSKLKLQNALFLADYNSHFTERWWRPKILKVVYRAQMLLAMVEFNVSGGGFHHDLHASFLCTGSNLASSLIAPFNHSQQGPKYC